VLDCTASMADRLSMRSRNALKIGLFGANCSSGVTYFKLAGVRAFPKPFGGTRPIIMNAGSTPIGQAFALRNCDAFFTATSSTRMSIEANVKKKYRKSRSKRAASDVRFRCSLSARLFSARVSARQTTIITMP
jgi:alkanesulfonate monooxygenase SsuD/methylene tetrahydromethanopterin reductase-like flavin-dependent oxidoreductase (luciferase family)